MQSTQDDVLRAVYETRTDNAYKEAGLRSKLTQTDPLSNY
jgi:hypothetical protein